MMLYVMQISEYVSFLYLLEDLYQADIIYCHGGQLIMMAMVT